MSKNLKLTTNIQSKLNYYFSSFGFVLTNPEIRCVKQMILGLLKGKSVFVNKVAGFLQESISLKKTCKRLAYHYNKEGFWKKVTEDHLHRVSEKVYHGDWLVLDLSDIQKKYARMMEGLAFVKDGNSDKIGLGYWLVNIIGINAKSENIIPLYNKLFSYECGSVSENKEIMAAIGTVRQIVKKTVTWILDRGADRPVLFGYFIENSLEFIIRLTKKRKLVYKGQKHAVNEISKKVKLNYQVWVTKIKKNRPVKMLYCIGAVQVQYEHKGQLEKMWLVVTKTDGKGYCWLLTNKVFDSAYEAATQTFEGYGFRWKIEEYHRHIKQQYSLEDIQIKTFNGLQSMLSILMIAMYMLYRELAPLHDRIILEGGIKTMVKNNIRELRNFIYYKIGTLVADLLAGVTFNDLNYKNLHPPENQLQLPLNLTDNLFLGDG